MVWRRCYDDSTAITALIFVLTVGADPTTALVNFADSMGMYPARYDAISLGQGQVKALQPVHPRTIPRCFVWECSQGWPV